MSEYICSRCGAAAPPPTGDDLPVCRPCLADGLRRTIDKCKARLTAGGLTPEQEADEGEDIDGCLETLKTMAGSGPWLERLQIVLGRRFTSSDLRRAWEKDPERVPMPPDGSHEIWRAGELMDVLAWEGPASSYASYPEPEDVAGGRRTLYERALARAHELRGLSYERRSPIWLESDHRAFPCQEVSKTEVAVTTPVGVFRIQARRVKKGETTSEIRMSSVAGIVGTGFRAAEDQESLPVELEGQLNAPGPFETKWDFQPSHFVYADGSHSGWLGCYPRDITWEGEAPW